jgi:hypothetical protein
VLELHAPNRDKRPNVQTRNLQVGEGGVQLTVSAYTPALVFCRVVRRGSAPGPLWGAVML